MSYDPNDYPSLGTTEGPLSVCTYYSPTEKGMLVPKSELEVPEPTSSHWSHHQNNMTYVKDEFPTEYQISNAPAQTTNATNYSDPVANHRYFNNVNGFNHRQFYESSAGVSSPPTSGSLSNSSMSPPDPLSEVFVNQRHRTMKSPIFCKICGDKASGYHYGVTSCEGCKGFFRRSIARKIDYRCLKQQCCEIRRDSRNRCQYCRFKKCLDAGMTKESVRQTRIKKTEDGTTVVYKVKPLQETDESYIAVADTVIRLHMQTCAFTEAKVATLIGKPFDLKLGNDLQRNRLHAWQSMAFEVDQEIQRAISFIREIPRLEAITGNDKATLLKSNMFPIYVLRIIRAFTTKGLMLEDGRIVDYGTVRLIFGDVSDEMIKTANYIRHIGCLDGDLAILSIVMLLQPISIENQREAGFRSTAVLHQLHEYFRTVLQKKMVARPNGYETLIHLNKVIPLIKNINSMAEKCFVGLLRLNRPFLMLPDLFVEVFRLSEYSFPAANSNQENYYTGSVTGSGSESSSSSTSPTGA